jgi:HSP20 family protein
MMAKRTNTSKKKNGANQTTALLGRNSEEVAKKIATTPFVFMRRFGEEMENLFDDFGLGHEWLAPITKGANLAQGLWTPQVEMFERDKELVVRADLPGLTKDDVKVEVANDGITIEGERKHESEEKGEGLYRSERSYGKFYRRLPIPEGIDPADATATFSNGVLEVTVPAPKRTERKTRRLQISGEGRAHRKAAGSARV